MDITNQYNQCSYSMFELYQAYICPGLYGCGLHYKHSLLCHSFTSLLSFSTVPPRDSLHCDYSFVAKLPLVSVVSCPRPRLAAVQVCQVVNSPVVIEAQSGLFTSRLHELEGKSRVVDPPTQQDTVTDFNQKLLGKTDNQDKIWSENLVVCPQLYLRLIVDSGLFMCTLCLFYIELVHFFY